MSVQVKTVTKEELKKYEVPDTDVGIQQWGCKEDVEYETGDGRKFKGDAFIFHLIVPDSFVPEGMLTLKTKDGREGEKICFKLNIGSYPKYVEYGVDEIFPRYLGKLSNNQHVVEMICPYKTEDLSDMGIVRKAIRAGDTHLSFVIV